MIPRTRLILTLALIGIYCALLYFDVVSPAALLWMRMAVRA